MSVVVTFTVPAQACALGRSLGENPEMSLELDRVIPTNDTVMPFFWVWGPDTDGFEAAAREEPAIDRLAAVDRVDGGALYNAEWNRDAAGTLRGLVETDGTILEAGATCVEWTFEVRFARSESATAFKRFCLDNGVPIELVRLSESTERPADRHYGLTREQREALAVAHREGYFDEPRGATLEELAGVLGISPRAVAGRLRRGQAALLEHTGITRHAVPS
ncbi:helix-turn-helix domain-containing protein [Halegenticoccus tardaugens]|uniref:helix-turn-helix domain-containing protein n=1 Tax=Halegenticoccus tardaugens TaxID=2071624 RepID=UPI00100A6F81|nr:helix-turn-helix domain-containing protein [Halegenticoccus tardaugens]